MYVFCYQQIFVAMFPVSSNYFVSSLCNELTDDRTTAVQISSGGFLVGFIMISVYQVALSSSSINFDTLKSHTFVLADITMAVISSLIYILEFFARMYTPHRIVSNHTIPHTLEFWKQDLPN